MPGGAIPLCIDGGAPVGPADMVAAPAGRKGGGMPPPGGGRNPGHARARERRSEVRVQNGRPREGDHELTRRRHRHAWRRRTTHSCSRFGITAFSSANRSITRNGRGPGDGLTRGSAGPAERRRRESHWRCARRSAHPGRSTHSGGSTHAGRRSTEPAAAHHSAHRSARETHCSRHSQPLAAPELGKRETLTRRSSA